MINALVAGTSQLTRVGDRTVGIDQHTLEMRLDSSGGGASIGDGDQVFATLSLMSNSTAHVDTCHSPLTG